MQSLLTTLSLSDAVEKSNPQGINQYTRGGGGGAPAAQQASAAAHSASQHANHVANTGKTRAEKVRAHIAAVRAHRSAAEAHRQAGSDKSAIAHHEKQAKNHHAQAEMWMPVPKGYTDRSSPNFGRLPKLRIH